jgi:hypothetical protein
MIQPHHNTSVTSVEDLLHLDDQSFIHHAYLTLLRRPADPSGFQAYQQVASNQYLRSLTAATHTWFDQLETMLLTLERDLSLSSSPTVSTQEPACDGAAHTCTPGSSPAVRAQEREELQHASEHAREIYFQLKDAVAHKKRVTLQ